MRAIPHTPKLMTRALLCAALLFCAAHVALAQDDDDEGPLSQGQEQAAAPQPPPQQRPNLFALLNLTPEQVGRIREIRLTSEPEGRAIVRRINLARRMLNEAIYSDAADESLVRERARALAEAQSAGTRLRVDVEWRIRNVLTTEQLGKLRDLRAQAQRQRRRDRLNNPDGRRRPNADAFNNNQPRRPIQRLRRRGVIP